MLNGILLFITGLALFLFGMMKLSAGMQIVLSGRIRNYIKFSVRNPFMGLVTGVGATTVFQSSSATTLLTVGIVSAGLISFRHSLGIILGADIGTTLTVQLVVWNVTRLSPFIIFAGVAIFLSGVERLKPIGEVIIYFGFIFFGLNLVGDATEPLKQSQYFLSLFREPKHPFLGLAVGIIFTAIVHASAIPISILIILGQQGLISLENALPVVLGANIGTTATAIVGSMFMSVSGKRSALAHLLFKCFGVGVCLLVFPFFIGLLKALSHNIAQQIALGHIILSLLIVAMFIFLLTPFAHIVEFILPGKDEALPLWPEYLDEKCLAKTSDALDCVNKELLREIMLAGRMFSGSVGLIADWNETRKKDIMYIELVVDNLQAEITSFLWNISSGELSPVLSKRLFAFSVIVDEIERIGDRSTNIVELSESRHKTKAAFTDQAYAEAEEIGNMVCKNIEDATFLLQTKDQSRTKDIFYRHEEIRLKAREAAEKHLKRFYMKQCRAEAGLLFIDILINLEVISGHCQIIAERIKGLSLDDYASSME
ncbi:MAG: Na/Pi cotransporter family protein [Syntrophobacterales bacterium]|jgi:phosphate:Na+ symporter|nr:Na/Pi cotransporter family protein [Syntrophobacterales bacterium]